MIEKIRAEGEVALVKYRTNISENNAEKWHLGQHPDTASALPRRRNPERVHSISWCIT